MAYEFAARHPELIAGVVALAPPVTRSALKVPANQPVHILHIHGTSDSLVPYGGDSAKTIPFPIGPQSFDFIGALASVEIWAGFNNCTDFGSDVETTLDLVEEIAEIDSTVSRYEACPPGGTVELWTIQGGDHFFVEPTTEFREKVIEWLLQHPKPQ